MSKQLAIRPAPHALIPSTDQVRRNRRASKADETKRALKKNWDAFEAWCAGSGATTLPAGPEAVESYLVYLADQHPVRRTAAGPVRHGLRPASVKQALWAINTVHRLRGLAAPGDSPIVRTAIAGIQRRKAGRRKQQAPLTIDELQRIRFPATLKGLRDRALLLVGFAGCLRRSELVALRLEDLEPTSRGLRVYLAQSKTDQLGAGAWVDLLRATRFVDACPVQALQQWLQAAGITAGPIFRSLTKGRSPTIGTRLSAVRVDAIVKWAAAECGLDPSRYGGHSLRAGKATYLANKNIHPTLVAKHGRWKSLDMVLTYYRDEVAVGLEGAY